MRWVTLTTAPRVPHTVAARKFDAEMDDDQTVAASRPRQPKRAMANGVPIMTPTKYS